MQFGFVIGNGESSNAVPGRIYENKQTWACNLAYRHLIPKNLVCCDKNILVTALSEGAANFSKVWTRSRWSRSVDLRSVNLLPDTLPFPKECKHDLPMHWGSGVYAAYLACQSQHDILVFIGFDLWPNSQGKVNNMFAGEKGYGPKDAAPVSPEGWIHQFERLFAHYPDQQFLFLNWPKWQPPASWLKHENFNQDDLKQINNL